MNNWKAKELTAIIIPTLVGGAIVIIPCVDMGGRFDKVFGSTHPRRRRVWNRFDPVTMTWAETLVTAMVNEVDTALEAGVKVVFVEEDLGAMPEEDVVDPYIVMQRAGVTP